MTVTEEEFSRRAFPKSQELLAATPVRTVGVLSVGWHGASVHAEQGAAAVVGLDAGLDDLLGELLHVSVDGREVYVLVFGARDVTQPLSLARRAFAALGLLANEKLDCVVEVC